MTTGKLPLLTDFVDSEHSGTSGIQVGMVSTKLRVSWMTEKVKSSYHKQELKMLVFLLFDQLMRTMSRPSLEMQTQREMTKTEQAS